MKPRALLLVLLAFAASTLSAADKLDALRKAGAKISTSPDGSVSIHFSVPKPPSGPFGEPIFDPNFRPSPPLEAAQLETLANIPKLRSLKLSGKALRPKAFETLEILTAARDLRTLDLRNVRGINDEALTHLASLASLEASTSRISEPSPTPDSHPSPSSRTCALSAYVPPKSPTTVSPPSLKPVTWRPSYLSSRASMAPDSFISNTFQSLPSSALTPTATPQTRHKSTYLHSQKVFLHCRP
jgi:hypothetical protein